MIHVSSFLDTWNCPDIFAPSEDVLVVSNSLLVSLEIHNIDLIKTNNSLPTSQISHGENVTSDELLFSEDSIKLVK